MNNLKVAAALQYIIKNTTTTSSPWVVNMKFCKNLQRVVDISDPEWAPYWTNYKMLKVGCRFQSCSAFVLLQQVTARPTAIHSLGLIIYFLISAFVVRAAVVPLNEYVFESIAPETVRFGCRRR